MFNKDFFPTPIEVIEEMIGAVNLNEKVVLEPSAGKGDIVDYCLTKGAEVIACESNQDLKKIVSSKCKVIANDFLTVESYQISHVHYIIMNPPFSADEKHILHAYNIAPAGCKIIALCNKNSIEKDIYSYRKELKTLIESHGHWINLGSCFDNAERKTNVEVALVNLQKPGANYETEFEGFFTDEDPQEQQFDGIMPYNVVRDLVNRYVEAIKIFDEQLSTAVKLNSLISSFFGSNLGFQCTNEKYRLSRNDFKKDLQKAGWKFIFNKMDLTKYATKGLKEDINKFVEQQTHIPFTMKNIYRMLEIVVGTASQRMDKAILEAFERVTDRHYDNRYNVKGWKTNLHYLVGKKFILPYVISPAKEYGFTSNTYRSLKNYHDGIIPDLEKALCFLTGDPYETNHYCNITHKWIKLGINTVNASINNNFYGEWYESHFFRYKGYKNGNMHFEFKDDDVWGKFNQKVAELKGFPLYEHKEQTNYQKRNAGKKVA
jgi:predicted RNA methylase